mgnify:CR=1 FL=1
MDGASLTPRLGAALPAEQRTAVEGLRTSERRAPRNTCILRADDIGPRLRTLRTGWAFRCRMLVDGRRQIVGVLLPGDTVFVSGAAGAVGSAVGQIARLRGASRVIGSAGTDEKVAVLTSRYGFDAAFNYKNGKVSRMLHEAAPDGIDVYFDNVGGEILDAVLTRINRKARIVICGAISQYNNTEAVKGPANYLSLLVNRAKMEGIVVFDNTARFPLAIAEMAGYLKAGTMKSREDVVRGLDTFPESLLKLFRGENFGKLVLQVAEG